MTAASAHASIEERHDFYRTALAALKEARFPFLVGGAYALRHYTGIIRDTKDLDLFVRPQDAHLIVDFFRSRGYAAEITADHWLGKVRSEGRELIDLIFGSGNNICLVDDDWFDNAARAEILGLPALMTPPEEMIWSKAFILERERFDGADVAHLLRSLAPKLDWERLLGRFGPNWRVLLSHMILFGFTYPAERDLLPQDVLSELLERARLETETPPPESRVCRGPLLSRAQYAQDLKQWGYEDPRLPPHGTLSPENLAQ